MARNLSSANVRKQVSCVFHVLSACSVSADLRYGDLQSTASASQAASQAPAMLRHEHELPHLPVNSLKETSDRWLHSVKPFTLDRGDQAAFQRAEQLAKDLIENPTSQKLQSRLEARANQEENWLIDCELSCLL